MYLLKVSRKIQTFIPHNVKGRIRLVTCQITVCHMFMLFGANWICHIDMDRDECIIDCGYRRAMKSWDEDGEALSKI